MKLLWESRAPLALEIAIGLTAGGAISVVIGRLNFNDPGVILAATQRLATSARGRRASHLAAPHAG